MLLIHLCRYTGSQTRKDSGTNSLSAPPGPSVMDGLQESMATTTTIMAEEPRTATMTVTTTNPTAETAAGSSNEGSTSEKRKRGRPKGSKNWPKHLPRPEKERRKRGRPLGVKNKPRDPNAPPKKPRTTPEANRTSGGPESRKEASDTDRAQRSERLKQLKKSKNAGRINRSLSPQHSLAYQQPLPTEPAIVPYVSTRYRNIAPAVEPAQRTGKQAIEASYDSIPYNGFNAVNRQVPNVMQEVGAISGHEELTGAFGTMDFGESPQVTTSPEEPAPAAYPTDLTNGSHWGEDGRMKLQAAAYGRATHPGQTFYTPSESSDSNIWVPIPQQLDAQPTTPSGEPVTTPYPVRVTAIWELEEDPQAESGRTGYGPAAQPARAAYVPNQSSSSISPEPVPNQIEPETLDPRLLGVGEPHGDVVGMTQDVPDELIAAEEQIKQASVDSGLFTEEELDVVCRDLEGALDQAAANPRFDLDQWVQTYHFKTMGQED